MDRTWALLLVAAVGTGDDNLEVPTPLPSIGCDAVVDLLTPESTLDVCQTAWIGQLAAGLTAGSRS
jgi:hypothetical protein